MYEFSTKDLQLWNNAINGIFVDVSDVDNSDIKQIIINLQS